MKDDELSTLFYILLKLTYVWETTEDDKDIASFSISEEIHYETRLNTPMGCKWLVRNLLSQSQPHLPAVHPAEDQRGSGDPGLGDKVLGPGLKDQSFDICAT